MNDEKKPQNGAMEGTKFYRKGNINELIPQPLAPCVTCIKWNNCGEFLWKDCNRFCEAVKAFREAKEEARRRATECF